MRVRWRGLELPNRVVPDTGNTDNYGKFVVEPFERGLGTTVGNSLRRILLSTIEGAAVTKVKIPGATHEFTSISGVQEDISDIILNIKTDLRRYFFSAKKTLHGCRSLYCLQITYYLNLQRYNLLFNAILMF